jgi:hypothetical protein
MSMEKTNGSGTTNGGTRPTGSGVGHRPSVTVDDGVYTVHELRRQNRGNRSGLA